MAIAGELVTESLDYDGGREVTMYVPPEPPEAMVFAGDGQPISQWGNVLEAAGVPSTMIVGAHRLADDLSASGELALALGLRHPDVYGAIFCASRLGGRTRCATQAWMLS
jgi:hypothetical protein